MTKPIVGIGELLWDIYPDGRKVAGGAPFNFAFHCHQLGHESVIVSRVGDDDLGRELRARVRELGLSDEFIQTDRKYPTGTVEVTLDGNGVPSYAITENVAWDYIAWDERLERLADSCEAVCFGSLAARGEHSRAALEEFVLTSSGLPVFDMNLRPGSNRAFVKEAMGYSHWVKMNQTEFEQVGEDFIRGSISQGAVLIVTYGGNGSIVQHYDHTIHEPGVSAKVIDTVGAGDAFTAAMVCLHLEGRSLRECARFANHYAARVCEHMGATPHIDRTEVERAAFGK